jgi:glutamate dehydrogenase/leucine dehydrogenase
MTIAIERVELNQRDLRGTHDQELAAIIGLAPENLDELMVTRVTNLGNICIQGTDIEEPAMRFHCGPEDTIKRGGSKFKWYSDEELMKDDGIDHARSMLFKIGGIGETEYAGGKTIAKINPRALTRDQMVDAMHQYAGLMHEAGLTDPTVDGTAGDEGTNGYIDHYVDALRNLGHTHPETTITGKFDMGPRAAATGRGAAVVHRAWMRNHGITETSTAVQGSGFAGAYYAAEAYDPLDPADRDIKIAIPAIGDLDPKTGQPVMLATRHKDGLPITRKMVDGILKNSENDEDMRATGGFKLAALSRKIKTETGLDTEIVERDVLTLTPEEAKTLAPAATSNVITRQNISSITIPTVLEIGNHTIHSEAQGLLGLLGVEVIPGELVNSGGVKMSIEENRRDLRRIKVAESNGLYLPIEASDAEYEAHLRDTMVTATNRAMRLAESRNVSLSTAIKAVGLANYAVSRGMQIDPEVRMMLTA